MSEIYLDINEITPASVEKWGYGENLYFLEQDEDLLLMDLNLVAVLMKLTADPDCPKQFYALSILMHFSQHIFAPRVVPSATKLVEIINASQHKNADELEDFVNYVFRNHALLVSPMKLSEKEVLTLAEDLIFAKTRTEKEYLSQVGVQQEFVATNRNIDDYREFKAITGSCFKYVYINAETGNWQCSRYDPLATIKQNTV